MKSEKQQANFLLSLAMMVWAENRTHNLSDDAERMRYVLLHEFDRVLLNNYEKLYPWFIRGKSIQGKISVVGI